jgi:AhpC/TSA family
MKRILCIALALFTTGLIHAAPAEGVVRPAPDFGWVDFNGKAKDLKSLRGQAVVLLIAPSPRDRAFRSQVGQLQKAYQRFAAAKLVCFAAFTQEGGMIQSNIPFVTVADGPRTAFLYDVTKGFTIAVIGPDGNLDNVTNKVIPAQRILDIMNANYAVQKGFRRDQGTGL